jgi:hypothetical protein
MASNITYVAASLCAAVLALLQRFGVAPMPVLQGTAVPAADVSAYGKAVNHTHTSARKADDWVPPRGRRL